MRKQNPIHRFFVSTALGFEEEVALEIQEVWGEILDLDGRPHCVPLMDLEVEKGGVSLSAPLHLGLQLNFFLKTPHRVLLRLKEFRCRDFPKLFAEIKKVNFKEFSDSTSWGLEVSASKSRLNHEGRIAETIRESLKLAEPSQAQPVAGQIFVRFFDDQCTISLDSTGEHLHFRGGDLHKGDAPLRETLAAFCLRKMIQGKGQAEISQIQWMDPMVGSGTFLLELAQLFDFNSHRSFAFQSWKKTPKILKSEAWLKNYNSKAKALLSLFGSDVDEKMIEIVKQNFLKQKLSSPQLAVSDLLNPDELSKTRTQFAIDSNRPLWIVLNPPYGERIEASFTPIDLLQAITDGFHPDRIGILFSRRQTQQLASNLKGYRVCEEHPISNGGLPCVFVIWDKI